MSNFNGKNIIVIIGGGPLGLWVSSQLKILLGDQIEVFVFEKREQYVREHILLLKKKYMKTDQISDKDLEDLKQAIVGKTPTKKLEFLLQSLAEKKGVIIKKGIEIESEEQIYDHVQKEKILAIVGADGRRSKIRINVMQKPKDQKNLEGFRQLSFLNILNLKNGYHRQWSYEKLKLKPEVEEKQNCIKEIVFTHQIMLKYQVKGKGQALNLQTQYKTLKLMDFPALEVVGKYDKNEDQTQITCIFFVDDQTAEKYKRFTPQKPGKFEELDGEILKAVDIWLNQKKEILNQKFTHQSEKFIYVPICVYSACSFAEINSKIPFFLVGDAAYGVPYFKSLNSGLLCGTRLAEIIKELFINKINQEESVTIYQKFMGEKVNSEFAKAHQKSTYFSISTQFLKFFKSQKIQFIKFSTEYQNKLIKHFETDPENTLIKKRSEIEIEQEIAEEDPNIILVYRKSEELKASSIQNEVLQIQQNFQLMYKEENQIQNNQAQQKQQQQKII